MKPLDQLHLTRMISRVTRDAEDKSKSIGITERRGRAAGLHGGDEFAQPALLRLDRRANVGPGKHLLAADIEPVFTCDDEGLDRPS